MGLVVLGVVWELATWIIGGSNTSLIFFGLSLVVIALVVHILNDWRTGVLVFLVWLLFEDLARKYLGNSMVVYFAKDLLVSVAYLSFYFAKRRRQVEIFKVPFLLPLGIFIAVAIIQVFNPISPSPLYGLLGLKIYFYYVPLMFLGYAMVSKPKDLEQLLVVNILVGIVISGLGIAQSVFGSHLPHAGRYGARTIRIVPSDPILAASRMRRPLPPVRSLSAPGDFPVI